MAVSSPSSTAVESATGNNQYSTLEVDHNRFLENDAQAAPSVGQDPKNEKIISYNDVGKQAVNVEVSEEKLISPAREIFGLRRKTFFILLSVVLVSVTAAAVGGGVGGTIAVRDGEQSASVSTGISSPTASQAPTSTRIEYANTGLAAMQWTDLNGTLHKRLYYQDNSDKIRESAWDNNTAFDSAWEVNAISDAVKPGTPIAAAAGYPHARYNYTLVCFALSFFSHY